MEERGIVKHANYMNQNIVRDVATKWQLSILVVGKSKYI